MGQTATPRRIAFVLYDNVQLLDVAGPADVFLQANRRAGGGAYDVCFVAAGAQTRCAGGLTMSAPPLSSLRGGLHTLVVPGGPVGPLTSAMSDTVLLRALARLAGRATRVVSICSGAYLLGALGLLDGLRATTHWMALDDFSTRFPQVRVDREALFVEDGRMWTSAGVASGIDLALALVSRDLGAALALQVAQDLVLHLVRPGGQSQFTGALSLQARAGPDLGRLIPWLDEHLAQEVTVAAMAQAVGMSERSFHRRCVASFRLPPARVLSELRLERARALLSDAWASVQDVGARCGFRDPATFSTAFARRFGASPTVFRRSFARKTTTS